jgi:hypothetical protein
MLFLKKGFPNWINSSTLTINSNSRFISQGMPRFFGFFFQTLEFGFKARSLQDTCHQWIIFEFIWKIKTGRFKTNLTLCLILRVNLRLGAYSMECEIHRTPCKRRLLGIWAPHSLEAVKKVLGRHPQDRVSKELEEPFRSTRKPAELDYEKLGGLSDPGSWNCAYGVYILSKGWAIFHILYLF